MITLIKEIISIFAFLAALIISRFEYADFIVGLQSGNVTDTLFLIPNMFKLILGSFLLYLLVYTLSRWWVWSGYHKVKFRYLITNSLLVVPFYFFIIILLSSIALVYSVLTTTLNIWVSTVFSMLGIISLYLVLMVWVTFSEALNMQGKNPWYNLYDSINYSCSKKGLNVLLLYLIPLLISAISSFGSLNPVYIPLSVLLTYLFSRQYLVSKKKTLKQYVLYICHSYTKTCKKAYKKVF